MLTLTITYDGKEYINATVAELLAQGVPQAAIDAHVASLRVDAIKAECRRRIFAVASSEAQINVSTLVGVISAKAASARTDQEKAILDAAEKGTQWVAAMRGAIAPLAANANADFTDDAAWPVCPPEAAAVYSQF